MSTLADRYRTAMLYGREAEAPMYTSCERHRSGKTFVTWRYTFRDGSTYDERVRTAVAVAKRGAA